MVVRRYTMVGTEYANPPGAATRKQMVHRLGAAVVAAAGGTILLKTKAARAAGLTAAASSPTVITVGPNNFNFINPVVTELIDEAIKPLLGANPGLEVKLFLAALSGAEASVYEPFMVAGVGPDIFGDFVLTGYTSANLALDLTTYVKRDNVNLNLFDQGEVLYIRQSGLQSSLNPNGLYALPCTGWPNMIAVNLGLLDQLGLAYPEPTWTYKEWTRLWEATTRKATASKPARVGLGTLDFWDGYDWTFDNISPWVLWGWGGEYVDPSNPARSFLDSPNTLAAAEWAWNLYWNGVISNSVSDSDFAVGNVASINQSPGDLITAAEKYRGLKWNYFNQPVWPARKTSYTSSNFNGIWAGTPHPDAAWTVLKWFCVSPVCQRLQMKATLAVPARLDQYAEFVQIVQNLMPPLRTKNVDVFAQQADANDMYTGLLYRYSSNQAKTIVSKMSSNLASRRTTVAEAFTAAAQQINALQAVGSKTAATTEKQGVAFAHEVAAARAGGAGYRFPSPSRIGAGVAPVAAASQVSVKATTWTVTGGGSGVNSGGIGATFAGGAFTGATGLFVCRITAIRAVKPAGKVNNGAKFGLIACSDLSSAPTNVGVEVAAGRGVHFHGIPFPGGAFVDEKPGSTYPGPGLLTESQILLSDGQPAKNYLKRPVWLKLARHLTNWTASTSLDGVVWQQAGVAQGAQMAGCWVGLFVTAHANGDLVQANFDHVQGLTPDTFVRIGAP